MTIYTVFFLAAVFEITTAFITQKIKRAVAEQAVEIVNRRIGMAGKILALKISVEFITVFHNYNFLSVVS